MNQSIKFRSASIKDLSLLQYWDKQPHVIASNPDDEWEWEEDLNNPMPWREQLIAMSEDKPIGFVQILNPSQEPSQYWGESVDPSWRAIDIWIGELHHLNKGFGTIMMRLALDRCFKDSSVQKVVIDPLASNTDAHRFYQRIGLRFMEKRRFSTDDCIVFQIDRADWQSL